MRALRTLALLAAAGSTLPLSAGCRDATSIEVSIDTDLPCERVAIVTTSIRTGNIADYEARPPTAETTRCDANTGRIGSLVLVPSEDDRAEIAVQIVTAKTNVRPERCLDDPAAAECIVARRIVRFVPHQSLFVPVHMTGSCAGVACGASDTCLEGKCVAAVGNWAALCETCDAESDAGAAGVRAKDGGGASSPPPPPPPADAGRPEKEKDKKEPKGN